MSKVRIIQHLCPERHCITAGAYTEGEESAESVKAAILKAEAALKLNPWCGICGATQFIWDDQPSMFDTMAEALPHLRKMQTENMLAALLSAAMPKPN